MDGLKNRLAVYFTNNKKMELIEFQSTPFFYVRDVRGSVLTTFSVIGLNKSPKLTSPKIPTNPKIVREIMEDVPPNKEETKSY